MGKSRLLVHPLTVYRISQCSIGGEGLWCGGLDGKNLAGRWVDGGKESCGSCCRVLLVGVKDPQTFRIDYISVFVDVYLLFRQAWGHNGFHSQICLGIYNFTSFGCRVCVRSNFQKKSCVLMRMTVDRGPIGEEKKMMLLWCFSNTPVRHKHHSSLYPPKKTPS